MYFPLKCILEPPSFVLKPESQAVIPNTTVRFKSTFKGTPPFTVKWFKEDTELITGPSCFTGLEGLSCFIDLLSVGVSQSGTYSCQVSNDAGAVKCTASLLVKGWTLLFLRLVTKKTVSSSHFHSCLIVTFAFVVISHCVCSFIPTYPTIATFSLTTTSCLHHRSSSINSYSCPHLPAAQLLQLIIFHLAFLDFHMHV